MSRKLKWESPGTYRKSEYSGLYGSWCDMHRRAGNKIGTRPSYSDVTICDRWLSYDNFFEDMSDTWFPGATIDKDIIKSGNRIYCPEYCKWVSRSENSKDCIRRNGNPMQNPEVSIKISGDNHPMKKSEVRNKISGKNSHNSKRVKCIETGKVYDNCSIAEKELGLIKNSVCNAANPNSNRKTTNGLHWEYV